MNAEDILINYYRDTADQYEADHLHENDNHIHACKLIGSLCSELNCTSILDTGCGTGRNLAYFKKHFPYARVVGNDLSLDLLKIAQDKHQIPADDLVCCSSYELPFADNSFDIVTEFAILHHVAEPERVVAEMLRVARQAIFISDSNRFGQGRMSSRLLKIILYKSRLWWPLRQIANGGKRWNYSAGDGVYYSYSVFDNLKQIEASCSRTFSISLSGERGAAISPWLFSDQVLICGFKK